MGQEVTLPSMILTSGEFLAIHTFFIEHQRKVYLYYGAFYKLAKIHIRKSLIILISIIAVKHFLKPGISMDSLVCIMLALIRLPYT